MISRGFPSIARRCPATSVVSFSIAKSPYLHQGYRLSSTAAEEALRSAPHYPTDPRQATAPSSSYTNTSSSSTVSPSSSSVETANLSWKDRFSSLPLFSKHKMTRNGTDFDMLPPPRTLPKFKFWNRFFYSAPFRTQKLDAFFKVENGQLLSMTTVYQHQTNPDIAVTLVPVSHAGHPQFYYQVDLLLCQHDSVLMEGRVPYKQAPFSTLVPPRPLPNQIRPVELEDSVQSWEPKDLSAYWQPFSWGVRDSPNYTVIHAADKYDYEKLPVLASLRFNMPLLGSFVRETHCLSMIPFLVDNGYKKFAIPWGAAHMPIMHEMLEHNGFRVVSVSALPIFDEADGEISQGHVRSASKIVQNAESRGDLWMAAIFSVVAGVMIYYTGRVEVNGIDIATGRATNPDDIKEFARYGRTNAERGISNPFTEMGKKTSGDFAAKFGG